MMSKARLVLLLCVVSSASFAASANAALPEFSKTGVGWTISSETTTLETTTGIKVKCGASSGSAEITSAKVLSKYTEVYKGCESGTAKCNSSEAGSGEVKIATLKGEIGYLNKSKKEVGLRLESASGKEHDLAEFTCGTTKVKVTGAVIGSLTPVNTETRNFTHTLEGSKGVQALTKFEGGVEEVLRVGVEGGEPVNGDITNTNGGKTTNTVVLAA